MSSCKKEMHSSEASTLRVSHPKALYDSAVQKNASRLVQGRSILDHDLLLQNSMDSSVRALFHRRLSQKGRKGKNLHVPTILTDDLQTNVSRRVLRTVHLTTRPTPRHTDRRETGHAGRDGEDIVDVCFDWRSLLQVFQSWWWCRCCGTQNHLDPLGRCWLQ